MLIGFYQYHVVQKDKMKNLEKIYSSLSRSKFDLITLPEMCTSGYLFESAKELVKYSEKIPGGETTSLLCKLSKSKSCYIVAGIVENMNGQLFNTAVLCGPEGYIGKYRKIHLAAAERKIFSAGKELPVFKVGNIKIGIQICFDIWFPESTRILMNKGAEIICHPSNFGGDKTPVISRTRSIENSVYTITANRIGNESVSEISAEFRGESQLVDNNGKVILKAGSEETTLLADLEIIPNRKKIILGIPLKSELKKYS